MLEVLMRVGKANANKFHCSNFQSKRIENVLNNTQPAYVIIFNTLYSVHNKINEAFKKDYEN